MLPYGTMSSNLGGEIHTSFVDELFLMDALKGVKCCLHGSGYNRLLE